MESLRQIVQRLPDHLIIRWKNAVADIRERGEIPTLKHISDFVRRQVKADFDPDFGDLQTRVESKTFQSRVEPKTFQTQRDQRRGVHSTQNHFNQSRFPMRCYMCQDAHRVSDCPTFVDSSMSEKLQVVKDNRLCFSCLVKGHMTQECRSKRKCNKNGCPKTHHPLLHTDPPSASSAVSTLDTDGILPVVRVCFRSANGQVREGNVLIDSEAGTTLIRRDFAKTLGLQGKREGLELSVVGGERLDQKNSRRLKFWISPCTGGEEYEIEAYEIEKTVVSVPPLDRPWLASFPHLADIEFSHRAGPVDLILGVQYSHLHAEEEIRQGLNFDPLGKRTRLGWMVIGTGSSAFSGVSVNFVQKTDFNRFYDLETLGVCGPDCLCPVNAISQEDRRALEMLEASCHKDGDRYVIGLPWKRDPSLLPDNYLLAEKRLGTLERSLSRNPERAELYTKAVKEYVDNQWAVPLTENELNNEDSPKYYLPHHGVYRPDKPSTPLRVVFDPACKYKGVSLNSFLHKGPCLIGDLYGVLLRFREEVVAFVGDISKMFLQICLPEQDTQMHRFLWRDMNATKTPTIYRLTRVTFGDKPSPDMASFVMLRLAAENEDTFPDAAHILQNDRYMDDLIHSCPTQNDAVMRMAVLDRILATGSFKIKKWFCSNTLKKRTTHQETTDYDKDLGQIDQVSLDSDDSVKTLGVCWNPGTDTITFRVKDRQEETLTKRRVLSRIAMLYDPLGLAAVVTIRARIAMQNLWRLDKIGWDDPLPPEHSEIWQDLFVDLGKLDAVQFPRCVKPDMASGVPELHVFADASTSAYGAVAYMMWHSTGGTSVRLLTAKGRVAPIRQTTVPRLELMAALIASKISQDCLQ